MSDFKCLNCVRSTVVFSIFKGAIRPSWTRTRTDDIISSRPVFFQHLACKSPPRTRALPSSVVPGSPGSPSALLKVTGDHSLTCFLSVLVLYLTTILSFLLSSVFFLVTYSILCRNPVWIDGTGDEKKKVT